MVEILQPATVFSLKSATSGRIFALRRHRIRTLRIFCSFVYNSQSNMSEYLRTILNRRDDTLKRVLLKKNEEVQTEDGLERFLLTYRKTSHPVVGDQSPAEVLIDRQIRTNHAAMLLSRNSTITQGTKQKRGYKAGQLVYTRDYRLKTTVGKCLRYYNQLRPRHSEASLAQTVILLFTLLDTFDIVDVLPAR